MEPGLKARWLTALVGLPAVFAALWAGGFWWAGLVLAVVALGLNEWRLLLEFRGLLPSGASTAVTVAGLALAAAAYLRGGPPGAMVAPAVVSFALGLWLESRAGHGAVRLVWAWAGLVAVAGALGHLVALREGPGGLLWTVTAIGGAWATDTGAFFIGRRFGGRPLAPRLSPKKTVSGAIGGLLSAVAWGGLVGVRGLGLAVGPALLMGLAIGLLAQAGDLLESAFKRFIGVKDSGELLPGHGGVLDRFDSLFLTAPAVFYFRLFFLFHP